MKKLLLLSLGILWLAAQGLVSQPVLADDADLSHMRHITVSGTSSGQFSPDQAILSMALVSKDMDLSKAKAHNDDMVNRLVNITREYDIPKKNVETSNIYIAPQYRYEPNREPELSGYTVSRQMRITMDSLDIHEKLLSAIVEAKIDHVNGIDFRLSDPEQFAMGLRIKAFENAKEKAEALAKAAGATLGKALMISTVSTSTDMPQPPMPMLARAMSAAASEMSMAPSLPGMVELKESVTVSFALE